MEKPWDYKDKVYIIGSLSQAEKIKKTANYYIGTGRYEVRYVKHGPEKCFSDVVTECFQNILWADRVYIIPKPDGTLGTGVIYEKVFAEIMGKDVDIFLTEEQFDKRYLNGKEE